LQQLGDAHTPTDINTGVISLVGLNHQLQEISTQEIVFLGLISTISMTVSLPKEKLTKLKQEAKSLLLKSKVTVQRLATFVGMTTASKQAICSLPLVSDKQSSSIGNIHGGSEAELPPDDRTISRSQGGANLVGTRSANLQQCSPADKNPRYGNRIRCILSGLGGNPERPPSKNRRPVVNREAEAPHQLTVVLLAVTSFAKEKMDINILIRADNISARAYINHFAEPTPIK